jgi:catechol 2,3-dioxygenase-like lactoylglutathione lyase family enzyme
MGNKAGGHRRIWEVDVTERPRMFVSGIVLDAPDAKELAAFYQRLLGWTVQQDEPDWVKLAAPGGGAGLSFQTESAYVRPTWPAGPGDQQMMLHLDIEVDDLEVAGAHAVASGATLADFQPQEDVRVYLDPGGHPFCLFVNG